jgi:hypothetical protein
MLVGADDGAIDAMHVPIELAGDIGLLLQGVKQWLEDASSRPAVKAARHGPPGAIALRQVVPGGAGTENPEHTVQDAAVVDSWQAGLGFVGRKQRLEPLPLRIGEVSSMPSTQ